MQGVRTFSIFAVAAAFHILLMVAVLDLQAPDSFCGPSRATLTDRLSLQDVPELYEVFGFSDPAPRAAGPVMAVPRPEFGCFVA